MDDDDCQFVVTEPVAAIVNQRVRQQRVPYSAPHTLSACADSSAWMNVVSMSRQVGAGLREFVMQEAGRVDTGCSGHRGAPIRDGCERSLEGSHR